MSPPPRLPGRLYLVDRWVAIVPATAEQLRDVVADNDGARGAWDVDTETIYVLASLSRKEQHRTLGHELIHAALDLLDA